MAKAPYPGQRPEGWVPPERPPSAGMPGFLKIGLIVLAVIAGLTILGSLLPKAAQQQLPASGVTDSPSAGAIATESAAPETPAGHVVTPRELFRAYAANEVAAQQFYGSQPITMTGRIDDITLDFMDNPVLSFNGGDVIRKVQASFDKDYAYWISRVSKGQTVTVRCEKISEVIGTPLLDDCVLVP